MNGNTVALKIEDLSYEYSATTPLINNVSLELNEGDILTILGRNGCGKTTLINCIFFCDNKCNSLKIQTIELHE